LGLSTQEDPIGLAGGLNLYGYAGGDPINSSDPYGLFDLKIVGEKLAEEIAAERARNPAADSVFSALEASEELFVMFDADEAGCEWSCPFAGWSTDRDDSFGHGEERTGMFPGARGISSIRLGHRQTKQDGIGGVAWHEATHLKGIVDHGRLNKHCSDAFNGVPNPCPKQ
jgi:hypothetical protein